MPRGFGGLAQTCPNTMSTDTGDADIAAVAVAAVAAVPSVGAPLFAPVAASALPDFFTNARGETIALRHWCPTGPTRAAVFVGASKRMKMSDKGGARGGTRRGFCLSALCGRANRTNTDSLGEDYVMIVHFFSYFLYLIFYFFSFLLAYLFLGFILMNCFYFISDYYACYILLLP